MAPSIVEISGHIIDSLILPKILDLMSTSALSLKFSIFRSVIGAPTAVMRETPAD
jgi:hypothetical protein